MDRISCESQECAVLTPAERAELEAENVVLIAKMKRLLKRWRPHDIDDPRGSHTGAAPSSRPDATA